MTYRELSEKYTSILAESGRDDASFAVRELIFSVFNIDRTWFILNSNCKIDKDNEAEFIKKFEKLLSGYPLQYLIGLWNFYGNDFKVGDGVLIPRPETEQIIDMVLDRYSTRSKLTFFDLCSGSGCIGITIAKMFPNSKVYLFEKSELAIKYIKENIKLNNVKNVVLNQCDITKDIPEDIQADVILSNPPYIETEIIPTLQKEVLFEPKMALDGGEDGLYFYHIIADKWLPLLKKEGFLAVEHGEKQGQSVSEIFRVLNDVRVINDVYGNERFVTGKK